jgi:hypothetical protein
VSSHQLLTQRFGEGADHERRHLPLNPPHHPRSNHPRPKRPSRPPRPPRHPTRRSPRPTPSRERDLTPPMSPMPPMPSRPATRSSRPPPRAPSARNQAVALESSVRSPTGSPRPSPEETQPLLHRLRPAVSLRGPPAKPARTEDRHQLPTEGKCRSRQRTESLRKAAAAGRRIGQDSQATPSPSRSPPDQ